MSKPWMMSVAVVAGLLMTGRAPAGSLDPTNAPGPTMHTLEEIYQKVQYLVSRTYSAAVPKTGQTNSYAFRDDGALKQGVAWPNPRFTVQADTNCVTDNLTGLMWARNANKFGAVSWDAAVDSCNTLTYGGFSDWRMPNAKELFSLIDFSTNNPALCNTAGTGQWTANDPFTEVQWGGQFYWSSTTDADPLGLGGYAWVVYLAGGSVYYGAKGDPAFVWPVRGGQ